LDGVHLNSKGAELVVDQYTTVIEQLLLQEVTVH